MDLIDRMISFREKQYGSHQKPPKERRWLSGGCPPVSGFSPSSVTSIWGERDYIVRKGAGASARCTRTCRLQLLGDGSAFSVGGPFPVPKWSAGTEAW